MQEIYFRTAPFMRRVCYSSQRSFMALPRGLMKNRVTILGGGAFGQALAHGLRKGRKEILVYNRTPKPGMTSRMHEALSFSRHIIMAVAAQHVRKMLHELAPFSCDVCFLASKGIEQDTGLLLSEVASEILPSCAIGVLGGPNLAAEVYQDWPCGLTVAAQDGRVQQLAHSLFSTSSFILEISSDIIGVQTAGAMKNVMAIGYGFLQQTCSSENLWASYLVLAVQEVGRLVSALGGARETLLSFSGIGDLILTSQSSKGRNSRFGRLWPNDAQDLVEGVPTTSAVLKRARTLGLDLPLTQGIYSILNKEMDIALWPHFLSQSHLWANTQGGELRTLKNQ